MFKVKQWGGRILIGGVVVMVLLFVSGHADEGADTLSDVAGVINQLGDGLATFLEAW